VGGDSPVPGIPFVHTRADTGGSGPRADGPCGGLGPVEGVRAPGTVLGVARTRQERRGGTRLRIVALVGVDGSGKTTQARRLADTLTRLGLPATYWQNAGGRRWFGRLARRLGRPDARRLLGRDGMLLAETALRWLAIARALVRSRWGRRVAVMDRYTVCQYASIRAHGGGRRWERLARFAYRVFPPPDVTFLLSVTPDEAYRRVEARGTDHESVDYLAAGVAAYRALPEFAGFVSVDADRHPDEVAGAILAGLRRWLPPEHVPPGHLRPGRGPWCGPGGHPAHGPPAPVPRRATVPGRPAHDGAGVGGERG